MKGNEGSPLYTGIKLGSVLGLRPLDRLQVNNAREIREMQIAPQLGYRAELPFLYFQRVLDDGRLEVRSPSGYATALDPWDVCSIVPGRPIIVRAMPRMRFVARSKLSLSERQLNPAPDCYADALVLYVTKDRWGRVDEVFVWFVDPALNGDRPYAAPIYDDDRAGLAQKARRTVMPVMGKGSRGASASADHGILHEEALASDVAKGLIRSAIRRDKQSVERLAMAGLKRIDRAALNRAVYGR